MTPRSVAPILALACAMVLACGPRGGAAPHAVAPAPDGGLVPQVAPAPPRLTADLPGLRRSGGLRILVQRRADAWLPRDGSPLDADRDQAAALAADLDLHAEFVSLDNFEDLIPALLDGRGDLVVANLTASDERRKQVAFSLPIALVREQVVTRRKDRKLEGPADLVGRRLAVQRSSSFWQSAQRLAAAHPGLKIEAAPEDLDEEGLLDAVAKGRLDLTIMDSNVMDAALHWHDDLRVAFDLGENRVIAWAMRPDARELRKAVDGFLAKSGRNPDARGRALHTADLAKMKERGVLRVLTRNSSTTYFITRGELVGFEYDLARRFADTLGLRLEIVVPPSHDKLVPWLLAGKGDLIAAGLTASPARARRDGVAFSRMMNEVRQTVVAAVGENASGRPVPRAVQELAGRTFVVRRSSGYWDTLEALRRTGAVDFSLVAAPESLETEEIIAGVGSGDYDLTLADSHIVDIELTWRDDVRAAPSRSASAIDHGLGGTPEQPRAAVAR